MDDEFGDPGLVFHGEENGTQRCAGPLSRDHRTNRCDGLAIALLLQLQRGE